MLLAIFLVRILCDLAKFIDLVLQIIGNFVNGILTISSDVLCCIVDVFFAGISCLLKSRNGIEQPAIAFHNAHKGCDESQGNNSQPY